MWTSRLLDFRMFAMQGHCCLGDNSQLLGCRRIENQKGLLRSAVGMTIGLRSDL